MAGETTRFRNPAGRAGLLSNLLAFVNALAGFLESRIALLAKESKAALAQLLALVACFVAALVFIVFGYVFLVASAILAVARITEMSWVSIALAAGGVHFLLALVCVLIARSRMAKLPFGEFSAELKKDREWLKTLDDTSRPRN